MSLSTIEASVPVLVRGLTILTSLLDKGAAHAREHNFEPSSYLNARLAADMLTVVGQVQREERGAVFNAAEAAR